MGTPDRYRNGRFAHKDNRERLKRTVVDDKMIHAGDTIGVFGVLRGKGVEDGTGLQSVQG